MKAVSTCAVEAQWTGLDGVLEGWRFLLLGQQALCCHPCEQHAAGDRRGAGPPARRVGPGSAAPGRRRLLRPSPLRRAEPAGSAR